MDILNAAFACGLFILPAPCPASAPATPPAAPAATTQRIAQWDGFIAQASRRFAIPDAWIRCVMAEESGGRIMLDSKPITSPKGAMGLMQVMPDTWADMRARFGLGADPYDPRDNILAGTAYLRLLADRFGPSGAFAAYNAGPGRYTAYLQGTQPLPLETRAYVARMASVLPEAGGAGSTLFIVNRAGSTVAGLSSVSDHPGFAGLVSAHDLFVPLSGPAR